MKPSKLFISLLFIFLLLQACQAGLETKQVVGNPGSVSADGDEGGDPPEVTLGKRLFFETRFAQFFQAHSNRNLNLPLSNGDPVMDTTEILTGSLPGPFKGTSMNCRACHMVEEQFKAPGGGLRSYDDFARRSPIPFREDGKTITVRNSPPLVNSTLPHNGDLFLHLDGEFSTIEDLVKNTFVGRNYGWLATERSQAIQHVADLIRYDDGAGDLAGSYGTLSYATVLLGTDPSIPKQYLIPPDFRIDVTQASNEAILNAVSKLVGTYVNSLVFGTANPGDTGSPFDLFLQKNNLPAQPNSGESTLDYSRRLLGLINAIPNPKFVSQADGKGNFKFHDQPFVFGAQELEGLKIFFSEPVKNLPQGKAANCIACHSAPNFTDFKFHNTGVAQEEYDFIHGKGSFAALPIPSLAERNARPDDYLPTSFQHPNATGIFADIPSTTQPGHTDLGLWNRYANGDAPVSQDSLTQLLCQMFITQVGGSCTPDLLLPMTIGLFKTPSIRDLGHGAPYMHNGSKDHLEDVIKHYIQFSNLAQSGQMRNSPLEFQGMILTEQDIPLLTAFLKSLNEDYSN